MARTQGRVKSFNAGKGFGFIDIGTGTDVFVHIKDCTDGKQPLMGDILSFILEPSASKPGQMVAKSVEGGTGAKEMFPGPQEPAPEVPGTGIHVGKVRTWNDTKGYGFIDLPGQPNVWLHVKECINTQPQAGDWVRFDVQPSETKQGQMVAKNVTGGSQPLGSRPGFGPVRTDLAGAGVAAACGPYGAVGLTTGYQAPVQQSVVPGGYVVQGVQMQQGMPLQGQVGVQQYGIQGQYVQQVGQVDPMQGQYVQGQLGAVGVQPQVDAMGQYVQQGQLGQMAMQPQQLGMQANGYQQYASQPQMQQYGMQQPGMMQPQYQQGMQVQMGMQPQGYQQMGMQPQQMQFQQTMPMQQQLQPMQQGFMQMPQQQMGQPTMQPMEMQAGFSSMGAAGVDPNAQMSLSGVAPPTLSSPAPMASVPLDPATAPAAESTPAVPAAAVAAAPAEPAALQAAEPAAPTAPVEAPSAAPAPEPAVAEAPAEAAAEATPATSEADASAVAAATPQ